jgi:penicillin-binding protein 2
MRDVVMTDAGTGKKARVLGVEVAGKTGTAQVAKMNEDRNRLNRGAEILRDHAWFISFAPVDAPEIAIACIVEHAGGGGGAFAAPVVQQVLDHYFNRNQGPVVPPAIQAGASPPPHG